MSSGDARIGSVSPPYTRLSAVATRLYRMALREIDGCPRRPCPRTRTAPGSRRFTPGTASHGPPPDSAQHPPCHVRPDVGAVAALLRPPPGEGAEASGAGGVRRGLR